MNKQIAILATACLVVSLVVAANILPRVLAQTASRELEKEIQSLPITNATKNQKTVTYIFVCNKQVLSQGEKLEGNCKLAASKTQFPIIGVCAVSSLQSGKDLEDSCDFKPIR
jgi:hypothetical protein